MPVAGGRESGSGRKEELQKDTEKLWGVIDIFIILIVMKFREHEYVKFYKISHFKCVYFIICQLHLNKAVFKKLV